MARPIIGICTALERAQWTVWDQEAVLISRSYVDAVQRAGGLAVLIPPDERSEQDPDEVLDVIDGLILAGGPDVDPATYGAEPHPKTVGVVRERDTFEIALARRAMERDVPLLGICRGMQVMNIAAGGTLDQHLPDSRGHEGHRRAIGTFDGSDHDVRLEPGTLAERAVGEAHHVTKSHHHQGVQRVGDGLVVSGWSALDEDLPEAIEVPGARFALGVQWHPEADETSRVIESFVHEAAAAAAQDARVAAADS